MRRPASIAASASSAARIEVGIRVVGVVDDRCAARCRGHLHPHPRHRGGRHGVERLVEVDADDAGNRDPGGGVGDHVRTGHGELGGAAPPRRVDAEPRTGQAVELDGADAHVAGDAERDHVSTGSGAHRRDTFVVGVEHGRPVGRQRFDQLTLGPSDAVDPADQFGVGVTDDGDHPDVRSGDLAELADVAEAAHAHLEDQHLGVVGGVQDRDRQSLFVVEAALVGGRAPARAAGCGHQVLGRRLADAAGDPDDPRVESGPRPLRECQQGLRGVGDLDRGAVSPERVGLAAEVGGGASARGRCR